MTGQPKQPTLPSCEKASAAHKLFLKLAYCFLQIEETICGAAYLLTTWYRWRLSIEETICGAAYAFSQLGNWRLSSAYHTSRSRDLESGVGLTRYLNLLLVPRKLCPINHDGGPPSAPPGLWRIRTRQLPMCSRGAVRCA